MKKFCLILSLLTVFLCSCDGQTAQTTDIADTTAAVTTAVQTTEETTKKATTEAVTAPEPARLYRSEVDFSEYKDELTADEYAALESYVSVLQGDKTFVWQGGWTDRDVQTVSISEFHAGLWEGNPSASPELMPYEIELIDLVGDDGYELVLTVRDIGYHRLVLHLAEDGNYYGIDYPIRWFSTIGKGLYEGSGGVSVRDIHSLQFENGRFEQEEIGSICELSDFCEYTVNGEQVSKEVYEKWESSLVFAEGKHIYLY